MDYDLTSGCFPPLKSLSRRWRYSRSRFSKAEVVPALDNTHHKDSCILERKVMDALPSYTTLIPDEPILEVDVLKTMEERVDELDPELRDISLQIHDYPELMFKEKFAHDTLTAFMASHGFTVTPHYLGLSTAWRASFKQGEGGPVLGVNSEMDALPGLGHACGHNLIAIAGVGVALGIKAALEAHDIPGEIILLGTPAEEGGGGKVILLERGGYDEMDACVMCHPGPGPELNFQLPTTLAIKPINVEFFGHTAHAAAAPWDGINALDAAVLSYTSISALRQQIKPTHRVHGVIEGKDWVANVIPDYARMPYLVRAPTGREVTELTKRVAACFEAAAKATGCTHKISYSALYSELVQNPALGREYAKVATKRYNLTETPNAGIASASTDFGNISQALPSIHPGFSIPAASANHTPEFAEATRTLEAHTATLWTTKALAATGIRLLSDSTFLKEVKDSFEYQRALRV
ncbi:amidohydrolase [Ramaria rubella]|nr:amidohydrolase [Ramaria rubella]